MDFKTITSDIYLDFFLDKWNEAEKFHSHKGQPDGNSLKRIGEFKNKTLDISFVKQKENKSFVEGTFMYCTNDVKLSPDVCGRQGDFLYSGSFHQFAAYGLYIKQFGHIPLRLYLCNNAA